MMKAKAFLIPWSFMRNWIYCSSQEKTFINERFFLIYLVVWLKFDMGYNERVTYLGRWGYYKDMGYCREKMETFLTG